MFQGINFGTTRASERGREYRERKEKRERERERERGSQMAQQRKPPRWRRKDERGAEGEGEGGQ